MAFYVIVVNFLVTLFMDEFTSKVIPTYYSFIQMWIIEAKFGTICDENLSQMIEIWMNNHLVSDSDCNTRTL